MTEHLVKKISCGFLIMGLLAGAADVCAVELSPYTTSAGATTAIINQSARNNESTQKALEKRGIQTQTSQNNSADSNTNTNFNSSSGTYRAFNEDDAAKLKKERSEKPVTVTQQASGAMNAASERFSNAYENGGGGVMGVLKGAWKATAGAVSDGFNIVAGNPEKVATDVRQNEAVSNATEALVVDNQTTSALQNASMVYEYQDKDGNAVSVYMDKNMKAVSGTMEGCVPMPVKLDELRTCIFCPLFEILYNTAKTMATSSFNSLKNGFKSLLLIGFALYVIFITLKQVSAFTKQDAPKYITELLTITFKVFLAFLLLMNGHALYRYGLEPIIKGGLEISGALMFHQGAGGGSGACSYSYGADSGSTQTFYSDNLHKSLDCLIKKITQEIAVMQSLGSSLMCVARNKNATLGVFPDINMFSSGLAMWVFGWLTALSFAWYLIDQVIRLGIIGAILPFLIAAWPFKVTSGYTKKGWSMFLTAFFTFAFIGLCVSVNVELAGQAVTGGDDNALTVLMDNLNNNNVDEIFELFDIGLVGFVFMIICCAFGWKICQDAATLAGEFGQGGVPSTGSKIGSLAAGIAKGATKRGIGLAADGGKLLARNVNVNGTSIAEHFSNGVNKAAGIVAKPLNYIDSIVTPGGRAARNASAANSFGKGGGGKPSTSNKGTPSPTEGANTPTPDNEIPDNTSMTPEQLAEEVNSKPLVSKPAREEMRNMLEDVAANGLNGRDANAVSSILSKAKQVPEYRKNIDDKTLSKVEERLNEAQHPEAATGAGENREEGTPTASENEKRELETEAQNQAEKNAQNQTHNSQGGKSKPKNENNSEFLTRIKDLEAEVNHLSALLNATQAEKDQVKKMFEEAKNGNPQAISALNEKIRELQQKRRKS